MEDRIPNLVTSGLSRPAPRDGVTVELAIYRLEYQTEWSLEVANATGPSIVWEDVFPTDDANYEEFLRTVDEEGMTAFQDSGKVIPFRR